MGNKSTQPCWYEHHWTPWRMLFYTEGEGWEAQKRAERYRECRRCKTVQYRPLERTAEVA